MATEYWLEDYERLCLNGEYVSRGTIMAMNTELILKLLKLASKYDITGCLLWSEDLEFAIICNDFFAPAADAQDIEDEYDLDLLEQSLKDLPSFGYLLYCARRRKMQPQKGYFSFIKDAGRYLKTLEFFEKVNDYKLKRFGKPDAKVTFDIAI